jgi:hypothetical protein
MFSAFGFSIQEFFICYFYCPKTAFVCEFQHTPLWKKKQEYGEAHSISTLKNGFFGLQNSVVPFGHREFIYFGQL